MISRRREFPIVALSVKIYRALLVTYPIRFQQEYSSQMIQVFQDCCLRTVRQKGTNGMLKLWSVTLLDFFQSVISEHAQKEVEMKKEMKPEELETAGLALIWGGIFFLVAMTLLATSARSLWGLSFLLVVYLSMPLLVLGLLGLRKRYGEKAGGFGKSILLLGVILGPLTSVILLLGNILSSWIVAFSGHAVLFTCLALFGLVALYKKPLPRWNAVPAIAGIWYPIIFLLYSLTRNTLNWDVPININVAILFAIQGIALAVLGYILKSDVPEGTVAPA